MNYTAKVCIEEQGKPKDFKSVSFTAATTSELMGSVTKIQQTTSLTNLATEIVIVDVLDSAQNVVFSIFCRKPMLDLWREERGYNYHL